MNSNRMYLIEKLFNNKRIRTVWNDGEKKYYISVVDVIEELTESEEPRKYWNWLKNKIQVGEHFQVSSIIKHLILGVRKVGTMNE